MENQELKITKMTAEEIEERDMEIEAYLATCDGYITI